MQAHLDEWLARTWWYDTKCERDSDASDSGSDSDSMSGLSGVLPPARKSVRFSAGPSEAGSSPSEAP